MKRLLTLTLTLFTAPAVLAHEDHASGTIQHLMHHLGQAEYWLLAGTICLTAICWYAWKQRGKKQQKNSASQDTIKLEQ
jgi:hypothetical protein